MPFCKTKIAGVIINVITPLRLTYLVRGNFDLPAVAGFVAPFSGVTTRRQLIGCRCHIDGINVNLSSSLRPLDPPALHQQSAAVGISCDHVLTGRHLLSARLFATGLFLKP